MNPVFMASAPPALRAADEMCRYPIQRDGAVNEDAH